jgi:hypothetical protein
VKNNLFWGALDEKSRVWINARSIQVVSDKSKRDFLEIDAGNHYFLI